MPTHAHSQHTLGGCAGCATALSWCFQFKVLLFNDNGNTREYVSRSLVQVVGLSEATAFHIMQQVRSVLFGFCQANIKGNVIASVVPCFRHV